MTSKTFYPRSIFWITVLGSILGLGPVAAGTLSLSTVPLSMSTSVNPNVFFEIDDSGSMDWEIMTQKYWTWNAYDPDETKIGGSFKSTNGGSYNEDGNWDSYSCSGTCSTSGSSSSSTSSSGGSGGWGGGGSSGGGSGSSSYSSQTFNYIYNKSDNLYGTGCGAALIACGTISYTTNYPYYLDWRILSASLNSIYFDPSASYSPWAGPCMTAGTLCANASFTAARSNPREGESGYSVTTDLTGFVYEVWVDNKGFSGTRPQRGTNVNATNTPNGIVDLWDTHIQYTVGASSVTVVTTTYAPDSTGMHPTTTTSTITGAQTDPYGRTVAQIQQNVANWFQYARKRSFVAKGAVAAVVNQNPSFRFGLSVINGSGTLFQEVPPASATDYSTYNTTLLANLFAYNWPASGTPLRAGLKNVGDYYKGVLSGKTNPIISACQKCFAILFTDGYWNGSFSSSSINDVDGDGISQTLADVARYYYINDLSSTYANNVVADNFDTATWQHMVTYGVAFGVKGNLTDTDGDGWPNPALNVNGNWGNPTTCSDCPPKIDDLWHAAYNSKGTFISAKNPSEVVAALQSALQDIGNRVSSLASVSLNSGSISSLTKLYQAKFDSSAWAGYLEAKSVSNGVLGSVVWEAGVLLPSAASRVILTYNGTSGIPFAWASLSAGQQTVLNTNIGGTNDGLGSDRLNWLRGDGSREVNNGGPFRYRKDTKLGDIIDSAPQYISNEDFHYADSLETVSYSSFVASKASRTPMVYVGANDGMLHGFDAVTGAEKIAYVPAAVYSNLSKLTAPSYTHRYFVNGTPTGGDAFYSGAWHTVLVGGLRSGGQGIYALDVTNPSNFSQGNAGSLVSWEFNDTSDADLGYTFSRPNIVRMANGTWAAVFGNGYNNTEADGHASTTGNAVLYIVNLQTGALMKKISTGVGTAQDPKGTARPNGLATVTPVDVNQDGIVDYIYGGDLFGNLWKFDVTSSSASSWTVAYSGAALFKACGGATCSGSNAQSITVKPTVGFGPNRQGYMVYFGTGKYLESTDLNDASTQTLYGIWDNGAVVSGRSQLLQQTITYEGTYTLQDGTTPSTPLRVTSSNHYTGSPPTQKGWYMDLTSPVSGAQGERVINQPILRNGRIIFTTTIPNSNACSGGGDSWLMELDALDGARLSESPFDLNNDEAFNSDEYVNVGGQWVVVSGVKYANSITATAAVASGDGKEIKFSSDSASGGTIRSMGENPGPVASGRQSWRQLK